MSTKLSVQVDTPEGWKKVVTAKKVQGCPMCYKAKDSEDVVATAHSADGNGSSELCKCYNCGTDYIVV